MKEPIDFYPWHGGRNGSRSKAGDIDVAIVIHEDVGLKESEHIINAQAEGYSYNLYVSMDNVEVVDTLYGTRYSQQLILKG